MAIPYSLLDLAPISEGFGVKDALNNSTLMAKEAERSAYERVWLAEHHGMQGVASSATSVVLTHIANATSSIKVGAGGIMLPNHAPLVIAEQFGTLAELFPNRIELGLGRAPGTDMATARALRRNLQGDVDSYPEDIRELQHYFGTPEEGQPIVAVPGANTHVPLWLLGSSLYSAQVAAKMGLPYSFASHFAPDALFDALHAYRSMFQPSAQLSTPKAMAGVMVVIAETDEEAEWLFTSVKQQFMNMRRGLNKPFAKPMYNFSEYCTATDEAMLSSVLRYALVGSKETVKTKLNKFIEETQIDEIIVSMPIYDINARLLSVKTFAELAG